MLPLVSEVSDPDAWPDHRRLEGNRTGFVAYGTRQRRFLFMIHTDNAPQAAIYFAQLYMAMASVAGTDTEPMLNLLCWYDGEDYRLVVIPRSKHRPDCYGDGDGQTLISPGTLDLAGLCALPRREDYDKLTADDVEDIYGEVCIDGATAVSIMEHYNAITTFNQ